MKYVSFPIETQKEMAVLLQLGEAHKPLIGLSYTPSLPEYEELILNLRWQLIGAEWRALNLKQYFSTAEKALEIFKDILNVQKTSHSDHYHNLANWLFSCESELSVSGENFEIGVHNMYELLTAKNDLSLPLILIKRTGGKIHCSYKIYRYTNKKKGFVYTAGKVT